MRVRDSYRPGPGRLALLLACPGGKCVVHLEGHRGRPPKEVDCPKHEKKGSAARRADAQGIASPPTRRPPRVHAAEKAGTGHPGIEPPGCRQPESRPAAPRPTSTVVEKQEEGAHCVNCGRRVRLAPSTRTVQLGLCWSCYHSRREHAGELKAARVDNPVNTSPESQADPSHCTPATPSGERPAKAPRRPRRASGERPATPQAAPAASDAGAGWRRVRDAELTQEAAAGVRKAIRALATTPRTSHLDPLEWERAVEEVLRAAQAAGWLDPDREAPGSVPGERGCR